MAAPVVSMQALLESGAHFGHQTHRWNPKMKPYIFGDRNGVHILDLSQTVPLMARALDFIGQTVAHGGKVLFVGTKRQAREILAEEARRCGMPYVDQRWLGGMLTNFKTVKVSIKRLKDMEAQQQDGVLERMTKKEALMFTREMEKLETSIGGIKDMAGLPDALFVLDVGYHKIAVTEANKLGIPVVAVVDTNHTPEGIDYVIPGNDDSGKAIRLYAQGIADSILEGRSASLNEVAKAASEDEFVEVEEAQAS